MRWPEGREIYHFAEKWKEDCFLGGGSLFCDQKLWTRKCFNDLYNVYVDSPKANGESYREILYNQLKPAKPESKRLWSEMEWLYVLIVSSLKRETKIDKIRTPWEWTGDSFPEDHSALGHVLNTGLVNPGIKYNAEKPKELEFMLVTMREWTNLSQKDRKALSENPWGFADWVDRLHEIKTHQFRHSLMHLLFPDYYEDILSLRSKRKIVEAFSQRVTNSVDIERLSLRELDQELFEVRKKLKQENPEILVNFFDPPHSEKWQTNVKPQVSKKRESNEEWFNQRFGTQSVWLLAPGQGARLWEDFKNLGIAAIAWDDLGDLTQYGSQDDITVKLQEFYSDTNIKLSLRALWEFSREMRNEDIIVAKRGRKVILGYGIVKGYYTYDEERSEYKNVRSVKWSLPKKPIELDELLAMKTLTRIENQPDWLREVIEEIDASSIEPPILGEDIDPPYEISKALEEIFIEETQLQQILDSIALRKNLILQGPPGVGKTFIARRIAWLLARKKDSSRIEMVQFHQSYAYEDFVQGWRPTESGGFNLRDGIFYKFCKQAEENLTQSFVFIIDEINRGNLSRIFGELLMLIEADKRGPEHAIALTYSASGEKFHVPENVYILGLMNTADRSLAIVDYALRRRFGFETLEAAFGKTSFRDHLLEIGVDHILVDKIENRLTSLNQQIREDNDLGSGFEIGHSYFVPEGEPDDNWYRVVIKTQIEPLLREYWFDHPEKVDEMVEDLLA